MPPVSRDREIQRAREAITAWRENKGTYTEQPAPEGLLPPRTAPDTPNVTRQYIENSDKLSSEVKRIALNRNPTTLYVPSPGLGGYYDGNGFTGETVSYYDNAGVAEHEAIHAANAKKRLADLYSYPGSTFSRERDVKRLADEGYPWAQETVDTLENNPLYAGANPYFRAQEYLAYAGMQNPAEVPPWFRDKHLYEYWSDEAKSAEPPPLPSDRAQMMNPDTAMQLSPEQNYYGPGPGLYARVRRLAADEEPRSYSFGYGGERQAGRVLSDLAEENRMLRNQYREFLESVPLPDWREGGLPPDVDYMSRQMRPNSPRDAVYERMENDPRRWRALRWKGGNYPRLEDPSSYQGPKTRDEYENPGSGYIGRTFGFY